MIIFAESSCLHSMIMLRISDLARDRFSHKSSSQPPEVRHAQSEEGQTRSMWLIWERKWHHAPCGPVYRMRVPALFSWRFLKISCRRVLQLQFKLFLDLYLLCNNIWGEQQYLSFDEGQTNHMWLLGKRKWHHALCGLRDRLRVPALFSQRFLKISCWRVLQLH